MQGLAADARGRAAAGRPRPAPGGRRVGTAAHGRFRTKLGAAPATVLLALIRVYQVLLSPLFAGSCRFVPSCSAYAAEAVARHGAARGLWLALRRLARCQPLCRGGLDPVPAPAPRDDFRRMPPTGPVS